MTVFIIMNLQSQVFQKDFNRAYFHFPLFTAVFLHIFKDFVYYLIFTKTQGRGHTYALFYTSNKPRKKMRIESKRNKTKQEQKVWGGGEVSC